MNGLVRAGEIGPGAFLTPPQYRDVYGESRFNTEMGAAASTIVSRAIEHRGPWTLAEVRELLAVSAAARSHLGGKAGIFYGYPVPTCPEEVEAPHHREAAKIPADLRREWSVRVFQLWGMLRDFLAGKSDIDPAKVSGTNHRALIATVEPPGAWCHIEIDGERLGLCVLVKDGSEYVLSHPSYERMAKVRGVAYDLLVRSLDAPAFDLDGIARAYQLLIHATPWFNGSASILETFVDAMMRTQGWAFPPKTSEPYFDAVFHTGVYSWRDLISNFDGTPKPLVYQVL